MRRLWLVLLVGGCGGSNLNLTQDEVDRMPYESRLTIYDGENDVVIARSRRDEATRQIVALKHESDDLDKRLDRSIERFKKAKQNDRISPLKKAISARQKYLSAQISTSEAAVRSADVGIAVARARLDAVKQRQLARTGRATAATIEEYEAKVASLQKWEKETQRRELDIRVEAQKVFETWKQAEEEYARATGDFDSGIWID
jgi:hypothetical protein